MTQAGSAFMKLASRHFHWTRGRPSRRQQPGVNATMLTSFQSFTSLTSSRAGGGWEDGAMAVSIGQKRASRRG